MTEILDAPQHVIWALSGISDQVMAENANRTQAEREAIADAVLDTTMQHLQTPAGEALAEWLKVQFENGPGKHGSFQRVQSSLQ